jgi:outer membrane assembly lipoprotein YfiO
LPFFLWVAVLTGVFLPGCLFHREGHTDLATAINPGDQPDKILFEKASNEIAHGRYDVGRLTLQTLINTYPDSEYLAKAKLAIADSYYEEGGVSGYTQSEVEYRDFITFFPTAAEAPEAQYRIGMAHFRLMAKADRDQSEAVLAEAELKEFLVKYPDNPLVVRVKARLRETQEVLGQGEFETASFYQVPQLQPRGRGPVWYGPDLGAPENTQGSGPLLLAFGS